MNKYQKLSIFLLLFVAVGVVLFKPTKTNLSPTTNPHPTETAQSTRLILNIDGQKQNLDASPYVHKTALEATQQLTKVETSGKAENAFITSINGRTADNSKHEFWALLINSNPAQVGAGSYTIEPGDTIEWQINTY